MPDIFNASDLQENPTPPVERDKQSTEEVPVQGSEIRNDTKLKRQLEDYSEVMRHESVSNNPLSAFISKPTKIHFDSQATQEKTILILRKHPITQIPWLLTAIALVFLPLLFTAIGFLSFLPANYQLAAGIFWYLLLSGFIFEKFLQWFFNIYIITDERIIDVDFISLIYKNVSSAKIDNIEDVTATTGGALQSVVDFGTIKIQTAAEKNVFEFEEVPHPARVARLLNELILEEEREAIEGRVH